MYDVWAIIPYSVCVFSTCFTLQNGTTPIWKKERKKERARETMCTMGLKTKELQTDLIHMPTFAAMKESIFMACINAMPMRSLFLLLDSMAHFGISFSFIDSTHAICQNSSMCCVLKYFCVFFSRSLSIWIIQLHHILFSPCTHALALFSSYQPNEWKHITSDITLNNAQMNSRAKDNITAWYHELIVAHTHMNTQSAQACHNNHARSLLLFSLFIRIIIINAYYLFGDIASVCLFLSPR